MPKLVQCIPNFSEGRDEAVINALVETARSVPGVALLDYSSDASHNRCVLTLVGPPEGVSEAAFKLCQLAAEKIDMTKHTGEHPRMGATDVVPFVPVKDITMEECVELAKHTAKRIADELSIPVFLYEDACTSESRRNLADVRRGQYEGMAEKLKLPEWRPDFGEPAPHPTAGVTAVSARMPLVAFNVNLNTPDVNIAKAIAKTVRGSSGGYKYCKALGVTIDGRNIAQVTMNMVNYEGTPLYRVFEAIKAEARRWGVSVIGTEIIGITPAKALVDCAEYYLQIEGFDYAKQVLENHIL